MGYIPLLFFAFVFSVYFKKLFNYISITQVLNLKKNHVTEKYSNK